MLDSGRRAMLLSLPFLNSAQKKTANKHNINIISPNCKEHFYRINKEQQHKPTNPYKTFRVTSSKTYITLTPPKNRGTSKNEGQWVLTPSQMTNKFHEGLFRWQTNTGNQVCSSYQLHGLKTLFPQTPCESRLIWRYTATVVRINQPLLPWLHSKTLYHWLWK